MTLPPKLPLLLALIIGSPSVQANLEVKFVESAPKDWFSLTNVGQCDLTDLTVTFDLSSTIGKLIFDTTELGAGVEVYQPFEVRQGNLELISDTGVKDGASSLSVRVNTLPPTQSASFTIDVDDTLVNSELGMIRVSQSEMSGGMITLQYGHAGADSDGATIETTAIFTETGTTVLKIPQCQ